MQSLRRSAKVKFLCDSDEILPLETLLEKADALMYEEKKKKGADRGKGSHAPLEAANRDLMRLGAG